MKLSVIILTLNEELHIEKCIKSIKPIAEEVIVVDSSSSDKTKEISESLGAIVVNKDSNTIAEKLNYTLENIPLKGEWIIRIDADEYLDEKAIREIQTLNIIDSNINGLRIKRTIKFLGKKMHDTSMYHVKIWRKGKAICENRRMDERMVLLEGESVSISGELIDENRNNLQRWINKHVNYAINEAIDQYETLKEDQVARLEGHLMGNQEERIRFWKNRYNRLPLFIRPFINFTYRFVLKGGIKSGIIGLVWCLMQGFWYRLVVDLIIFECHINKNEDESPISYLTNKYIQK
jgi:glycosyltransferase involved in cell wall biosynthesis